MEESVGSAMIKLTDQNWVTWKPRMEGILYCKDLHEPIEGDEAKPEEMTEKQWYIQNRKAIGTIIQWVDDSVFRHVAQETNAHKLWTKLELMFERKAVTKKFFLIKDLVNMKYKEDMSMTEHLNNFQNIINQQATMGMALENELQALLLLSSLPDGWETFITTVSDSAANGVLSVDFVKDSMQNEEKRKKTSGVSTEQMESGNQKMEDDKNTTVVVHFRALERPKEDEFCLELYKIDDERVTKEDIKRALEDQYGGAEELQEEEEMPVPHSDLVEGKGPQPIEVGPAENPGTVENQASDEPQASRFTWMIESFSRLNVKKLYSEVFIVGGYKWRVLIFPKGNNVDYLSMYLDVGDAATLPYGWNRYAQFSLAVVNQIHSKYTVKKDTQHQFNQRESDWGFTSFMPLSEIYDPSKGYIVNDTCVIEADVAVRKVIDSKEETG